MKVFMHSKNDLKRRVFKSLIALLPLYFYGIYKNGILLFEKSLIGFGEIFKLIYLVIIGLIIYAMVNIIFRKKIKLDLDFLNIFIIPLFMMPNINYWVYALGLFVGLVLGNLLEKFIRINKVALVKLVIVLAVVIISNYTYMNKAEALNLYAFNGFDMLWGRNIGGIGATSIIWGLVFLILMSLDNDYKTLIFISSVISYSVVALIFKNLDMIMAGTNILSLILIAPDSSSSPIGNKAMIFYGLAIGILGGILTKFGLFYEGVLISILICNLIYEIVCKITKKVL